MQATDWIREKTQSFTTIQTTTNVLLRNVTSSSRAPIVSNNNISFLCLSNTLQGTITSTPQNLDAEILRLMNEARYFNCKKRGIQCLITPKKVRFL